MPTLTYSVALTAGQPENINDVATRFTEVATVVNALDTNNYTNASVTDTDLTSPNNSVYRTISQASFIMHDLQGASTGYPFQGGLAAFGTNQTATEAVVPILYLDDADYTVASKTTRLRVRAQCLVNDFGAGITVTWGLYPITAVGSGGLGDQIRLTNGTVITGSTVAFAAPVANSLGQGNSGDFAFPADGHYVLGAVLSGAPTVNSKAYLSAQLQLRHT